MKSKRISLFILCLTCCFLSCSNDDDGGSEVVVTPPRDRNEQQATDKEALETYLKTHYYNKSDFENNTNPKIVDLEITALAEGETEAPTGYVLLMDDLKAENNPNGKLELHTTKFADTDYEFYILRLNQGGGAVIPKFSDNVLGAYEGYTLDADLNNLSEAFDSKVNPDTYFDLTTLIPAWRRVYTKFNIAEGFVENGDGTVNFTNAGLGVMFVPSGLGYFQDARPGIPAYSPLIFKIELINTTENDHDGDGIPSYLEDLNRDGDFTFNSEVDVFDGDDTDGNGLLNYLDLDDDGDGIPTANEIEDLFEIKTYNEATKVALEALTFAANEMLFVIKEELNGTFTGITITSTDSDGDGILDYLDAD